MIKLPAAEGRLGSTVVLGGESYELTEEVWAGTGQTKTLEYVEAHLVRT